MATVTFQTIVCNNSSGSVSLRFEPSTEPNPFWVGSLNANQSISLNIQRTFGASATVTLLRGIRKDDAIISSPGTLRLPFTIGSLKFTVTCNVTN
jgi:hypothetical protein